MRRRLSTPKASPLLLKRGGSAEKPPKKQQQKDVVSSTPVKAEKTSWFKSLDRRAKSQPKEQVSPASSALSFSLTYSLPCHTAAGVSEWTQRDQLQLEAQQAQSERCAGQEFALLW